MNKKELEKKVEEHEKILRHMLSCPFGDGYDDLVETLKEDEPEVMAAASNEVIDNYKKLAQSIHTISTIHDNFDRIMNYKWMKFNGWVLPHLKNYKAYIEREYDGLPKWKDIMVSTPSSMSVAQALIESVEISKLYHGDTFDIWHDVKSFALCVGLELLKNEDKYEVVDPTDPPEWDCEEEPVEELEVLMETNVEWGRIQVYDKPDHHLVIVDWAHLDALDSEDLGDIIKDWVSEGDDFWDARILDVKDRMFYLVEKES